MGKLKKIKKKEGGDSFIKPGPLENQIERGTVEDQGFKKPKEKLNRKRTHSNVSEDGARYVDSSLSHKILSEARKQKAEMEMDSDGSEDGEREEKESFKKPGKPVRAVRNPPSFSLRQDFPPLTGGNAMSDEEEDSDKESIASSDYDPNFEIDEDEEKALEKFMSSDPGTRRTLADIIQKKIASKEQDLASEFTDASMQVRDMDPRIVEMYRGVRDVLQTYRSGKLPKAFKIVPKLVNWEQVLQITEPDSWTAAAMYQATRIFCSNLNVKMCQRFYNLVLLPRIRDDIAEYKKLNFHLYQALKKSLFKPAAFFKGILIPLCESGTCTLREATIVGSVMTKCTIPMLHAAAALLKIAEMPYSGGNSLFIRVIIDKKYTLPFRVIDALVYHFLRFASDKREMTVLWHQSLLAVAQRYKTDMSSEQKDSLLEIVKIHRHHQISPEIIRELQHAAPRDVEDGSTMKNPDEMDMED